MWYISSRFYWIASDVGRCTWLICWLCELTTDEPVSVTDHIGVYSVMVLYEKQCPSKLMIDLLECRPRRIISKRSFFPACWASAVWDTGAGQVCDALTSAARGNVGIWPQWLRADRRASGHITILVHPLSLRPPEHRWATESCCHSNGQACRCPWGSFLDRIPRRPLSVKGRPLCWMAVYLCRRVSFSVPWLPSSLFALFSSSSLLILDAKTHL